MTVRQTLLHVRYVLFYSPTMILIVIKLPAEEKPSRIVNFEFMGTKSRRCGNINHAYHT